MYNANNLQVKELVNNMIRVIKQDQGKAIKIQIQSEAALHTEEERSALYKNFNMNDETQHISIVQRKKPTIYSTPKFINLVTITYSVKFSSKPDQKYPKDGCQQNIIPAPGSCLSHQPHKDFSAYNEYSSSILVIAHRVKAITSLITENFHRNLSIH